MSAKTSKAASALKQGTLGFASKRTGSTNLIAKDKKPTRAHSTPTLAHKPALIERQPSSAEEVKEIEEHELTGSADDQSSKDDIKKQQPLGSQKDKQDVVKVTIRPRRVVSGPAVPRKIEAKPKEIDDGVARPQLEVNDTKWKKQHALAREKMGGLKPIHGENQTKVHEILRVFDLSYEYGPCIGMTRLERWERAAALGLNPPPEIREILLTKQGVIQADFCLDVFHDEV